MKVLIVSESDIDGGAARAAYRLHRSLLAQNIKSQMLVQRKISDDYTVKSSTSKISRVISRLRPLIDRLPLLLYKQRTKTLFSPSLLPFSKIIDQINEYKPDVVHLHWIASGMIPIKDLSKINAKVVWSCHDMWPLTGGCHYDEECEGYKITCRDCKVLGRNDAILSRQVFKKKLAAYRQIGSLAMIGSSRWMTRCIASSQLTRGLESFTLPNCIDTQIFKPIEKDVARSFFKIPQGKKVVLFSAMNVLGDPRKGAREVFEAIEKLEKNNVVVVIAGSSKPETPPDLSCEVYYISPLYDEVSLALMYNIADVIVVPSLQENLANSIVESMACGVPVVAFNVGGNPDLIDHEINGYLAHSYDTTDLAQGISWIINNDSYCRISKSAITKVMSNYESNLVAKKYIGLYEKILEDS
ncbi:glycosyltransferase family 4 protein [Vibrio sp. 2-2(8)]|uniref:glycosyltransferase family 4 protein n=1 Tax=Vibrio sp. 2-2(8) TaxID=2591014 RepID=UPI0014821AFC|nr:glycosyltransferase family 4 protein [Vibrio sp. 2-2(8)]NNN48626.1 glycosyltransferase [Vibrio sp. 2-2(8)]